MNDTHEVISAFLDDEPFDADSLSAALSAPDGRDLLIDLVALRHLVQAEGKSTVMAPSHRPSLRRPALLAAIAASLIALAGGYLLGERRAEFEASTAPPPTRIVQAAGTWQTELAEGVR